VENTLVSIGSEEKPLVSLQSPNIEDHFPFSEVRPAQATAMQTVVKAHSQNKKFTIIEAPTGMGKSGVGLAVASWAKTLRSNQRGVFPGSYYLSPQKSLTAQMMRDFEENGLLELKGKSNYHCHTHNVDCDTGSVINKSSNQGDDREVCGGCPYKAAKSAFIDNPFGVTNFSYYLNETQYAGQLPNREFLVLDEGHNVERLILDFADTTITRNRMNEINLGALPVFEPGQNVKCLNWLHTEFVPACGTYMQFLENELKLAKIEGRRDETVQFSKKLDSYDKFLCRLNRFINTDDLSNWLCYTSEEDLRNNKPAELVIKPLTASLFADEILFRKAANVLIMSATILDFRTVMRNLGINDSNAELLALPSDFPVENRPIFFKPVGNMNYKEKDKTLPKMVQLVEKILTKYADKKGIVHTHSYAINKAIVDHLRGTAHKFRIITHTSFPGSRDQAILDHMMSPEPTVLFSPSMSEGLDLKEDLSRFQIICKVPYPFMDVYIKARMRKDPSWYQLQTALTLVQATGRSVRTKTDKAHTFILDGDFERFLNMNQRILPRWWTNSLVF
jgi:ATP-dependent DNA helicase DinG